MRRFVFPLALFLQCLLFPLPLYAQDAFDLDVRDVLDIHEEAEGRGLIVRSNPSGARVFVDGIERGRTPLHLETLRGGQYVVRLVREGYVDRVFRVAVRTNSLTSVFLELPLAVGRVLLRLQNTQGSTSASLQFNPRISVDGQMIDALTLAAPLELPVGLRTIRVEAFGWEARSVSVFVTEGSFQELDLDVQAARFTLSRERVSRRRFNPANAGSLGTTVIHFEVSAPGEASFTVQNRQGETVFARRLPPFDTWLQTVVWDGTDMHGEVLPDGMYTLTVHAVSLPHDTATPIEETIPLIAAIDSSRVIYPLASSSGKSGLLYAPLPVALPPASFQIEASLLAGSFLQSGGTWKSLPFSAAFRFSLVPHLEHSIALHASPHFSGATDLGIGASAAWVFLRQTETMLPTAAIGASFSYTSTHDSTPFGMPSGLEVFFPIGVDVARNFSVSLTPAVLWTVGKGFVWEGVPYLLVSGGLLLKMQYYSVGLSVRNKFDLSAQTKQPLTIAGAEVRFFPPPSNLVFSFTAGAWVQDGTSGGFGGFGLGMIY